MSEPTIEVNGFFKPKQVTREEFVKQWSELVGDLYNIANTPTHIADVAAMVIQVRNIAGAEFDRVLAVQTKGEDL